MRDILRYSSLKSQRSRSLSWHPIKRMMGVSRGDKTAKNFRFFCATLFSLVGGSFVQLLTLYTNTPPAGGIVLHWQCLVDLTRLHGSNPTLVDLKVAIRGHWCLAEALVHMRHYPDRLRYRRCAPGWYDRSEPLDCQGKPQSANDWPNASSRLTLGLFEVTLFLNGSCPSH